uniref:Uncharacterized protein n=1 Tax=Rhizophora mucronata TaxID=61149 RepID=A0A2P2PVZ5_RHIMU
MWLKEDEAEDCRAENYQYICIKGCEYSNNTTNAITPPAS